MDILESKTRFDDKLINTIKKLKFKNNKVDIKGTASLASQKYFSDYDLFTQIVGNYTNEQIYDEINKILNRIRKDSDLYFTELKIQNKNGKKKKYFKMDFSKEDFIKNIKDLDFIKIDLIGRFSNIFTEVSIIYNFSTEKLTSEDYLKKLNDDIKELKKEGKFYKILKRVFSLAKINKDKKLLLNLGEFFNSDIGQLYQKMSNLEAIEKLLDMYDDDITIKKALINLKDINEEPKLEKINKNIKDLNMIINKEGLSKLKSLKIKI
jgi:hypothetical protein